MAAPTLSHLAQYGGLVFPLKNGEPVHDFEDYTFQAPRPGYFLGDSRDLDGGENPVSRLGRRNSSSFIPRGRTARAPFIGTLEKLPTELLWHCFTYLDICSLLAFRRVSQHTMRIVDCYPPFEMISTFPRLISAVDTLECRSWTAETMLHCIRDERCSICGHFGDLLYLVTPERWCYKCWLSRDDLVAQRFKPAMLREDESFLAHLHRHIPSVRFSTGFYGIYGTVPVNERITGFDQRALRKAWPAAAEWRGHDVKLGHAARYTTVIRAPYWDAETADYEEGFFCKACAAQGHTHRGDVSVFAREEYPIWGLPWRRYTRLGFHAHIDEHGRIRKVQDHEGVARFAHENPFTGSVWDEPDELRRIAHTLRRCKDEGLRFSPGQPFLAGWEQVRGRMF
ncbi:hypothetical protein ACN47E_008812 [Coniothyrium glycines]